MKLSKRIISVALTLIMLIGTLTALPLGVSAKNTDLAEVGGYDTSYTLTGNGAADMVAIANKQLWKSGPDLGYYSRNWCSFFVCECAKLTGQTAAIPYYGLVTDLYPNVIAAGGQVVSTPQTGDLVFYYCNWTNKYCHVGIMTDSVNSIQGNMTHISEDVDRVRPIVADGAYYHCTNSSGKYTNACTTEIYVRPNYKGGGTPVKPVNPMPGASTLTVNAGTSSTYTTFSWTPTENTDHYELWVKNPADNSTIIYQGGLTNTQYRLQLPEGNYKAYIASIDNDRYEVNISPWWTYSNEVNFSVAYDPFQDSLPVNLSADFYATIIKSDTGIPLHSSNNNVQLADPNNLNDYSHIWHFIMKNDGSYMIINCEDSKPLTVANKGTTDATNVETYMNLDYDSQRWYIYKNGENQYVLKPKHCNLVLDVEWNNNAYGTNVHIYKYNGAEAQLFDIQYQPKATKPELTVSAGDTQTKTKFFFASDDTTQYYNLYLLSGIPGSVSKYDTKWNITKDSVELSLPVGYYEAYAESFNGYSEVKGDIVKFYVTDEDNSTAPDTEPITESSEKPSTRPTVEPGTFPNTSPSASTVVTIPDSNPMDTPILPSDELVADAEIADQETGYVYFNWPPVEGAVDYDFTLYDFDGNEVFTHEISDTTYVWNPEDTIIGYFSVASKDAQGKILSESALYSFTLITNEIQLAGNFGDVDENFKINIKDATAIQKHLANMIELSDFATRLADANADEKVNIKDATTIQKYCANLKPKSQIGEMLTDSYTQDEVYVEKQEDTEPTESCVIEPSTPATEPTTTEVTEPATSAVPDENRLSINYGTGFTTANVGDKITYSLMLETANPLNTVNGLINYDSTKLKIVNEDYKMCPNLETKDEDPIVNTTKENKVHFNAVSVIYPIYFNEIKPLITIEFEVIGEGETEISHEIDTLGMFYTDEFYYDYGEPVITEGISLAPVIESDDALSIIASSQTFTANAGDTITYYLELEADELFEDIQGSVFYDSTKLKLIPQTSAYYCPLLSKQIEDMYNLLTNDTLENEFRFLASEITEGFDFTDKRTLVMLEFEVIETGTTAIDCEIDHMTIFGGDSYYFKDGNAGITEGISLTTSLE